MQTMTRWLFKPRTVVIHIFFLAISTVSSIVDLRKISSFVSIVLSGLLAWVSFGPLMPSYIFTAKLWFELLDSFVSHLHRQLNMILLLGIKHEQGMDCSLSQSCLQTQHPIFFPILIFEINRDINVKTVVVALTKQ